MKNRFYYGVEVSRYGFENNRVDLETLSQVVGGVLNNEIIKKTVASGLGTWQIVNGSLYTFFDTDGNEYTNEEALERIRELEEMIEEADEDQNAAIEAWKADIESLDRPEENTIYQYYIVSRRGAELLMEETNETVFFNPELDMFVWGITTYGTAWNCLLTGIPLERPGQAE